MLTRQPRSRKSARAPRLTRRPALPSNASAALRRAAGLALTLALLAQMFILGGARAAAQAQRPFDVDEGATAQVVRLPAQPAGAAAADFSALSAARQEVGKDVTAAALKDGAEQLVEPPPAPDEPAEAEAAPVIKSARGGKAASRSRLSASGAGDKSGVASLSSDPGTSPPPAASFQAQSDPGPVAPPDAGGAVGLDKVMSTHRSNYVVQDKSGAVLSSVPIELFWAATGATGVYNPRVVYDPYNHRWLVSAVSNARSAASSVLVGVSQTSDPSGAYHLFRFDADENDQLWADFPSLGFNKNWAVVTFNAHNIAGDGFNQGRVLALDYAALRAGTPSAVTFANITTGNGGFAMQPAVTYSATEEMLYLVSHLGSGAATYRASRIEPSPDGPALVVGVQKVNGLGGWTQPGGEILPQAPPAGGGAARKIDSSDSRAQKVVFRNGGIYYCQTVGLPAGRTAATVDRTAAQWTQLDAGGDFVQGGRVEDPTATPTNGGKWYAYPSLSVNRFDDLLVGFSEFSATQYPAAGYAVRVAGDAPGSTRAPHVYKAGEGYYEKTLTGTRNLWGLYSTAQVDPANDRDIWTIQEYAAAPSGTGNNSGRWGTRWARVVPSNRPPAVSITSPASGATYLDPAAVQLAAAASDPDGQVVSVEFFNGQTKIGDGVQTAPGTFTFTWQNVPAGTYTVTARATDNEGAAAVSAPVTITVRPVSSLSDDFNDNSPDQSRWVVIGDRTFEQNGRLEITPPDNATGYPGYYARQLFDLTNRRATVEAVQIAPQIYGIETYFLLHDPATENHLIFATGGGGFILQSRTNGAISRQIITYNPAQHRFWRFRHDPADDSVNFDMSPDGVAWTTYRKQPRPFNIKALQAILTCGKYTATTPAHTAVFDNYRVEDNPPPRTILADDFNDNSRDAAKWNLLDPASPTQAAEQNQRLEITPNANTAAYNGFVSAQAFDMTNADASVEVVQLSAGPAANTIHSLWTNDNSGFLIIAESNRLHFRRQINGWYDQTFIDYNAAQHRFWRIRHDALGDAVHWETSPDRVTWTAHRSVARDIAITSMYVILYGGSWAVSGAPYTPGVFDNFRAERHGPALAPSDNFDDNSLDPARWTVLDANSPTQVREQNRRLEISLVPNTVGYNGVVAVPAVDFRDKSLQVELVQPVSMGGWVENHFALRRDDNNAYYFAVGAGSFVCDAKTNGVLDRTHVWYNPAQHRFWRFRHNGAANTMNFEVSPDGQTWTTLKTVAVAFPLDSMKVWVFAGAWGTGNAAPGTAVYDNLRLTPNE